MSYPILTSDDEHQKMLLLLPWYHNQSLEQDERQQVEKHLRSCLICRSEMIEVGKLATAIKQSSVLEVAAEASFASLRGKLQTTRPVPQISVPSLEQSRLAVIGGVTNVTTGLLVDASRPRRRVFCFNNRIFKSFAFAASLVLLTIPVIMQYGPQSSGTADYFTLSGPKQEVFGGTRLRVVFEKSLSVVGVESLLEKVHGQIVDGPNLVGGYTVRIDSDKDAAIALLRNQQEIVLVEPVLEE
jgi:hypothetical protein